MLRTDFLKVLKIANPAIATRDYVPVFACFCFEEKAVHAFDDFAGVVVPFQSPLQGGLLGSILYNWLNASRATELAFTMEGSEVNIKAGRANLKMTVLPTTDFAFKLPTDSYVEMKVGNSFLAVLVLAQVSIGVDPQRAWQYGVTLQFGEKDTIFYSTDNVSATRATLQGVTLKDTAPVILPPKFVDLLKSMSNRSPLHALRFGKTWVTATFEDGVVLYSKMSSETEVAEYTKIFENENFETCCKNLHEIPKNFGFAIDRSLVVLSNESFPIVDFSIAESRLTLVAGSGSINGKDVMVFEGHPESKGEVSPMALQKGLHYATHIGIDDRSCLMLSGPNYEHIIALVFNS